MSDFLPPRPSSWRVARLSDVATFQNGHAFYKDGYSTEGLIAIDLYNVDEDGRLRFGERDKHVSAELCERFAKFKLNRNDLVMVMTDMTQRLGILGKCAMVDQSDRYILNQRMGRVTANESVVLTRYLYYFINSEYFLKPLRAVAKGAVQKYVNTGDIKENNVLLPPLPVQRRIAGILSAYDELMENSQRRIRLLEAMVRALYREWFVHFRFPGYEKVPLVASSLGDIPKGWEVKKLGEIAEDMRRNIPKGELEEPKPYVGLEHIPRRSLALDAWENATELGSNKLEFKKGEVLFGKIRPYFHKVSVAPFDGLCSADTVVIRSRRPEHYAAVVACVSSDAFVAEASATANGAKMPRANWDVLEKYQVVIPKGKVAEKFSALFADIITQQQALIFQIQNLRRTRDLLLPRLLSGTVNLDNNQLP